MRQIRGTLFWLSALALACVAPPVDGLDPRTQIPPDINERFLAPDLDTERWTSIFEGEAREIFTSRQAIVAALKLQPGMRVADVGAGTGFFSVLFAAAVGEQGRVYALDISPRFVESLRARVSEAGLTQIEVTQNSDRSVGLAAESIDVAFLCDVYHHFEHADAMLKSLLEALRPGGQLVVIDFERIPGVSRAWLLGHVRAGKEVFRAEILGAGFERAQELEIEGLSENYMLRFIRP